MLLLTNSLHNHWNCIHNESTLLNHYIKKFNCLFVCVCVFISFYNLIILWKWSILVLIKSEDYRWYFNRWYQQQQLDNCVLIKRMMSLLLTDISFVLHIFREFVFFSIQIYIYECMSMYVFICFLGNLEIEIQSYIYSALAKEVATEAKAQTTVWNIYNICIIGVLYLYK